MKNKTVSVKSNKNKAQQKLMFCEVIADCAVSSYLIIQTLHAS
jgi:hypothetical protein